MRCVFACCCCFLYHFPSFRREGGRREVLAIYRQFWSKMWGSGRRRGGPNYRPGRPASQPTGDCTGYDLAWTWAGQRSEGGGVPHIFLRSPLNLRARSSGNCCAVKFQAGFIEEPLSALLLVLPVPKRYSIVREAPAHMVLSFVTRKLHCIGLSL